MEGKVLRSLLIYRGRKYDRGSLIHDLPAKNYDMMIAERDIEYMPSIEKVEGDKEAEEVKKETKKPAVNKRRTKKK
jgi:hypothetical protein